MIKAEKDEGINGHKTLEQLAELLVKVISVEQSPGTDVIEVSAESQITL